MKKFIVLILVLAIVGGVAYFFLSNSMAMTAMISQNHDKVMIMHNKAYNKTSNYSGYDLNIKYTKDDGDGVEKTLYNVDLKIANADESKNFKATVTDKRDGEVNITYYYKDGVLYTLKGETKTKRTLTLSQALAVVTIDTDVECLWDYESIKLTEENFEAIGSFTGCGITAKFNPLYIGCKNTWTKEREYEGEPTIIYLEKIDAGCTLRYIETKSDYGDKKYEKSAITINKPGKKVSVTFPENFDGYTSTDPVEAIEEELGV